MKMYLLADRSGKIFFTVTDRIQIRIQKICLDLGPLDNCKTKFVYNFY
jgi:hypothetical protein